MENSENSHYWYYVALLPNFRLQICKLTAMKSKVTHQTRNNLKMRKLHVSRAVKHDIS